MGMFDNVECEVPLPDGLVGQVFQTKDFDMPSMDTYTIRADGRLIRKRNSFYLPDWEQDQPPETEDVNFHGFLNFYTSSGERSDGSWQWHEYKAKFTDGQLVDIETVTRA